MNRTLFDGVPVTMLTDQQLMEDYNAINNQTLHEFYRDKGMYLFFRQRELLYECEKRGLTVDSPWDFVGYSKADFKPWRPKYADQRASYDRLELALTGDQTMYGVPIDISSLKREIPIF